MELRRYWEIICRRKWILILAIIVIPLISYMLLEIISPIYQSKAKLWVKMNTLSPAFLKDIPNDVGVLSFIDKDNAMGTIEELLKSTFVIGRVIREMDLRDKNGDLFTEKDFTDPNIIKLIRKKKGVDIDYLTDSEVFEITGYSNKPSEAKEITERVIREFLGTFVKMYKDEIKTAKKVIKSQLLDVEKRLNDAEQAAEDYRNRNKVFNIPTQITTLITEISNLEAEADKTVRSLQESKTSIETIKKASLSDQTGFKEAVATIEDNPVITTYKEQLLNLEINLAKLTTELTPEHPDVKIVKNQIDGIKSAIKNEISKSFASQVVGRSSFYDNLATKYSNTMIDIVMLTAREGILAKQIKEKQKRLDEIPEKERKFGELSRTIDNLKTVYNSLTLNLETAESAEKLDLSNAFIFQLPVLSENIKNNLYFPPDKKTFHLAVAIFAAIFFGIFLVFFLEYLDDSLWSPEEIEKNLSQQVIGVIQKVRKSEVTIGRLDRSPLSDSIYNLLANIKLLKCNELGKVISIVSTVRGEGKSVLAAFITIALTQQGKKVILVDGNLRYPFIHNIFNLSNTKGLSNYLFDDIKIQDTTSSTSISNLNVITSGSVSITDPQRYLESDKFSGLIQTLIKDYDIILVDTPAFANGTDALIISKHADDLLFVVGQGKTSEKKAKEFIAALDRAKIKVTGVVLNKVQHI